MNLPTDLLRSFVTVAELGSFTTAADVLGRSQPAISLQIKRLEEMVNQALFQRRNRRLELTEKGQHLFDYSRQILALNDEVVASFIRPKVVGKIHLGIPNEFAASFLPDVLRRFTQTHPEVVVQVSCDLSVNLIQRIQRNEFDVVLALHQGRTPQSAVCTWMEDIVWVGAPGFSVQNKLSLPLIVAPEGCVYRARIMRVLNQRTRNWQVVYTSPNYSGIRAGVAAGLGITAIARSTVVDGMRILGSNEHLPALDDVEMGLHYGSEKVSSVSHHLGEHIASYVERTRPANAHLSLAS